MKKTIKEMTIEELLSQRKILIKKLTSIFCGYNAFINIPSQIKEIDGLILKLNDAEN